MPTCIITGAGSGIGRAVAITLAQAGYFDKFALIGRNELAIESTIQEMKKGSSCKAIVFYPVDLTELEKIPGIVARIHQEMGEFRCLLNIAGYTNPKPLLATGLDDFEKTYKVNVYAPFILMRETTKFMKVTGGKILNVASTAGMTPRPGWLSYSSSKAALISMSETLTEELAEYGIKMYCVSPGRCATKLRKKLAPDEDPSTIMQPEEVAAVICKLIDPNECCLDGQNIVIRKQIASQ